MLYGAALLLLQTLVYYYYGASHYTREECGILQNSATMHFTSKVKVEMDSNPIC